MTKRDRSCKLILQFFTRRYSLILCIIEYLPIGTGFAFSDSHWTGGILMSSKSLILGVCSIIVATVLMTSIVYGVTLESLSNFSQLLSRVPEPFTMVLIGAGLILLSVWRRKRLINKH